MLFRSGQILSFTPIWEPPVITLNPPLKTGEWVLDEDTLFDQYNLETPVNLHDEDVRGCEPQNCGESIDDLNWSILYQGLETTVFTTDSFRLSVISSAPGSLFEDKLFFETFANKITEGVSLTIRVTDSQGLSDQTTLKLVITPVNDPPSFVNFPTPCDLLGKSGICMSEDETPSLTFSQWITDALDIPPDELTVAFFNGAPGENYSESGSLKCSAGSPLFEYSSPEDVFNAAINNSSKTLEIIPNVNQNHQSQPGGEIMTLCVSDGKAFTATSFPVYVNPVNDYPMIEKPLNGAFFQVGEDSEITTSIIGNDKRDGVTVFDSSILRWFIEPTGRGHIFEFSEDGQDLVVRSEPEFSSTEPLDYQLTLEEVSGPEDQRLSTSVSFTVSSFPVSDPPFIRSIQGDSQLRLSVGEGEIMSYLIKDYLEVGDQEGVGTSTHAWSFKNSECGADDLISSPKIGGSSEEVRFSLLNSTAVNMDAKLLVEPLSSQTTGTVQLDLFVIDKSECPGSPRPGFDKVGIEYTFLSINDPPAINPQDIPFKLRKDDEVGQTFSLTSWKVDADTPSNQLCFDLVGFDRGKISASMRPGYGPAIAGQTNCTTDELTIIPVPGALGKTSLQLRLFDSVDQKSATYTIPIEIVDSVPQLVTDGLSLATLTFTSDTTVRVPLSGLVIDDESVVAIGLSTLATTMPGFYVENLDVGIIWVDFDAGDLRIDPRYDVFQDGLGSFELYYRDSEQNTAQVVITALKNQAFLEWARFDDVNGTEAFDAGDKIVLKFSEDRKSTRLNSSHSQQSRMPSSA